MTCVVGAAETGGGGGGGGSILTSSGKLSLARLPLKRTAASSYARAAASAVSNVPNQTLAALWGSLISAAHFPHGLCLTPLYLRLSPVSSAACSEAAAAVMVVVVVVAVDIILVASSFTAGAKTEDSALLEPAAL